MDVFQGKYNIDEVSINTLGEVIIEGWIISDEDYTLRAYIGQKEVSLNKQNTERKDVQDLFNLDYSSCGFRDNIAVQEEDLQDVLQIQIQYKGKWLILYKKDMIELMNENEFILHHIDSTVLQKKQVTIQGWTFDKLGRVPNINIPRCKKYSVCLKERQDVYNAYNNVLVNNKVGFEIVIEEPMHALVSIEYSINDYKIEDKINIGALKKQRIKQRLDKVMLLMHLVNRARIKKGIAYFRQNGLKQLIKKLKIIVSENKGYTKWILQQLPTKEELDYQRQYHFEFNPLISIVVPTFNTPKNFLIEMIESVINQSYSNWELCIADGNSQDADTIKILKGYIEKDKRIKVKFLEENMGISGNTNKCLELAMGEFVGLFDHDDLLTPNALYEVVKVLNSHRDLDFIYSDEDKTDEEGKEFFDPHFKPDWSPDTLTSYNYICHFTVFRRRLLQDIGGFNKEFDGSQDYDLFLRLTEKTQKIYHIPKILYHWRVHRNSTAASLDAKEYTIDAARRALQEHLNRLAIKGSVEPGLIRGTHHITYDIQGTPKVSIIIPNKDHIEDLSKCINSIKKSSYLNYEIVIVENNSEQESTFRYYEKLREETNIKVIEWKDEFNYSAINNYGVQYATGEYIILLNNDIEIITSDWIEQMLMYCQRKEVGIVGAKLYYPDNTVQHAGVIIGIGGVAGHSHKYFTKDDNGYFSRLKIVQNLSAVTAACLMVRRDVFESVNGLDQAFKVAFNDVDFCLRVRERGYLTIFTPYVEAYHHESKSRGAEDTLEKQKRFQGEVERFYTRWGAYRRDPYYNKNLTLEQEDFGLNMRVEDDKNISIMKDSKDEK